MNRAMKSMVRPALLALAAFSPAILLAQPPAAAPPAPAEPPSVGIWKLGEGRSFLGVGVKEIDAERAKALKLKEEYGVEITSVETESPAEKAGLKNGDVVLEFNGQRVEGTEQFIRLVRETPSGRTVRLLVSRGGGQMTVTPALAARKARTIAINPPAIHWDQFELPAIPDVPMAMMSWRSPVLGIVAESLESQLAAYFGVKQGVLVRSVVSGSTAEKAGFKAGDVILKVDGSSVASPREVTSAIRAARDSKKTSVPVAVVRDRKETSLTIAMPEEQTPAPRPSRATTIRRMQL